ncbi:MAG: hypothetical protein KAJ47_03275, partial [Candidatus Aenigmarchaeota archaeon]|nr:hypothetical protein [Candidatus Aenigmarchaeota archaeon]
MSDTIDKSDNDEISQAFKAVSDERLDKFTPYRLESYEIYTKNGYPIDNLKPIQLGTELKAVPSLENLSNTRPSNTDSDGIDPEDFRIDEKQPVKTEEPEPAERKSKVLDLEEFRINTPQPNLQSNTHEEPSKRASDEQKPNITQKDMDVYESLPEDSKVTSEKPQSKNLRYDQIDFDDLGLKVFIPGKAGLLTEPQCNYY